MSTTADLQDTAPGADADADATPAVRWVASAVKELSIVAYAVGVTGSFTLWWGDGTSTVSTGGAGTLSHTYTTPNSYTLTVKQGEAIVAQAVVFVRAGLKPTVTFTADPDNPNIVVAAFGDDPAELISRYEITWGTGGPTQQVTAAKGDTVTHGFPAGTHTITVRDLSSGRTLREDVVVTDKTYDPDFSIGRGGDVQTAELTLTVVGTAKEVLVDWGDGAQDTIPAPAVGSKVSHTYTGAATHIVQAAYSDGTGEPAARIVEIPFAADEAGD